MGSGFVGVRACAGLGFRVCYGVWFVRCVNAYGSLGFRACQGPGFKADWGLGVRVKVQTLLGLRSVRV